MSRLDQYEYRPGLKFKSKYAATQVCVQGAEPIYTGSPPVQVGRLKEIVAEFATHGAEYTYTNPETGAQERAADIRGYFLDLDQQAYDKDWTDEEREMVAKKLLFVCDTEPGEIWLYSKPAVPKPWPKYDEAHHNQVATLAEQLGLVHEALAYEQENKNRESVVAKLKEIISAPTEDALTAV